MATKTVCDICNTVVTKIGKDYTIVPVVVRGDCDLHTGRSETTIMWEDICVKCFEKTYTKYTVHFGKVE